MPPPPVMEGQLSETSAMAALQEVEALRLTGVLVFSSQGASGEIAFFGGEIAEEQSPVGEDAADPLDLFLSLEEGSFAVHPRLPPLPVSRGDEVSRSGSLAVHAPADLMRYCERAGLSGTLSLTHAEQRVEATYDGGELVAIELDGEDADLEVVFGWEAGDFVVATDFAAAQKQSEMPAQGAAVDAESPSSALEAGAASPFLRVLEVALADITEQRDRARDSGRSGPEMPPVPRSRRRPASMPPRARRRRRDQPTVRLIYRSGESPLPAMPSEPPPPSPTPEVERLPSPSITEPRSMAKRKKRKKKSTVRGQSNAASGSEPSPAGTAEDVPAGEAEAAPLQPVPTTEPEAPGASLLGALGWACAVCVLGLTILAFLAALPAVSCPAGQEACGWGTGCVRVASDREHCGACGNVCEGECRFGRCETGD